LFSDGLIGSFERWRLKRGLTDERVNIHLDGLLGPAKAQPATRAPRTEVAIDVKKARKTFGSVVAVDDVDMQVMRAEIHGLVGANGSGKTSLLNVFNGFSKLNAGSVTINGTDITRLSSPRIARLGIGRTFQTPRIFNAMSLWENLEIGLDANQGKPVAPPEVIAAMKAAMSEQSVDLVPHGQRRMLEVMRVVLKGADVLFLDEPAAGLSPGEREEFKTLLRRLRDEMGKTIVLVEHDLQLVWDVADRITVLEAGKMVASGTGAEIANNPSVRKLFIEPTHA
jgi:branched-chain amino acid transport system permease protein